MTTTSTAISSLAAMAAMFAMTAAQAGDMPAGSSGLAVSAGDKVHCYGVHNCKGNSDCATAEHACKGHNGCKGHGFKAMKADACLKDGGTIGDIKAK